MTHDQKIRYTACFAGTAVGAFWLGVWPGFIPALLTLAALGAGLGMIWVGERE